MGREVLVRDGAEQVGDAVEAGEFLGVSVDVHPRRGVGVRVLQHFVLRLGVLNPSVATLDIHRRQLPSTEGGRGTTEQKRVRSTRLTTPPKLGRRIRKAYRLVVSEMRPWKRFS